MRRVISRSKPTLCQALGIVSLGVAVGCSGTPTDSSPADPAELPEAEIRALIQEHTEFSRPLTIEVMSAIVSPTVRTLATDGYLELEDEGPVRAALTDKGRAHGLVELVFEYGKPYYTVPIARRELVELSSVEVWPRKAPAKRVAFTYRQSPVAVGRDLVAAGSQLSELGLDRIFNGEATLVLHADGWKVHSLKL